MKVKIKLIEFLNYKVYRIIIGEFFRLIYGNDSGFFNNMKGSATLKNINESSKWSQNLKKLGFSELDEGFHDASTIEVIKEDFEKHILEIEAKSPITRQVALIEPLLPKVPQVKQLVGTRMIRLLDEYYGVGKWKVYRAEAWRNYFWDVPTDKEVHSDLMHNDYDSTDILRVFIYLNDGITRENGATKLLSKVDTKNTMRKGYVTRYVMTRQARNYMEKHMRYMEGNTGFSFIFNPQLCLHAAGRVAKSKNRDVLVLSFCKTDKLLRDFNLSELEAEQVRFFDSGFSIEWK
jgi:hypothetical protein